MKPPTPLPSCSGSTSVWVNMMLSESRLYSENPTGTLPSKAS